MKNAKKIICALMVTAFLLVCMGTAVFAAEDGDAWLSIAETEEGNTVVSIVAVAVITDGLVEVTYDSENLTYSGLEVNADYVDVYSVNADEAGKIKLAWVSAGAYTAEETGLVLISISFTGRSVMDAALYGEMNDAQGNALTIRDAAVREVIEKNELKKAIFLARGLVADNYTESSYAAMLSELEAAEAVLNDIHASQADVDAAAEALNAAIDALELIQEGLDEEAQVLEKALLKAQGLDKNLYTADSFAVLEAALAAANELLANAGTAEEYLAAAEALNEAIRNLELNPDAPATGDYQTTTMILMIALAVTCVGAVTILLISKKGRCAK